ncbi:MAG TPA: Maf family nucleotide pyrophosphatase [Hypericibacter adhaerens]|jgi:septum formation protein|uniref:Maf family protein n=1 Tax=Hypericibacter adhaerens TaxID=2602016 RepID=UPI002C72D273|nr:Maf family nucleotide pyrophosphatase [Hypericibacter adhaerens]HWA41988.1 Maf family nucleotide pyrophosphatase [Hypericibacter adhaerens]
MPTDEPSPRLLLASASPTRRRMLEQAGLVFAAEAAPVDEEEAKRSLESEGADAAALAEALAELKARAVSRRHPGRFVIGADQVLDCEGRRFDKPPDAAAARAQLMALRGKTHELISAAVVVRDGERLWHHTARARLTMRPFSPAFLDEYLARGLPDILGSVGAYRLEGLGAQLFSRIEGDYFTILGLPLLPLLDFLRPHGLVPA